MTGEWFSWLSHDDLYLPRKIESQIAYINELLEKNPDIDLNKITVRCATVSIDKDRNVIRRPDYSGVKEREDAIDTIVNNVYNYRLSGCSFLLPASCVEKVGGFDESIRTVSDVDYWYRLLFEGYEFYCLTDERLVMNRSHGQQVGKTKVDLFEKELNDLHIAIADRLVKYQAENIDKYIVKFYKGLVYRHMGRASKYVKKTHLREHTTMLQYYVLIPVEVFVRWSAGACRNVLRRVYRRLKVK
jgi:GT2 family glycosyltransferase